MTKKLLAVLREGLSRLKETNSRRREEITAAITAQQLVSPDDEDWLDNAGNHVEEQQLIDELEQATNLEQAVAGLGERQKGLVARLKEMAGGVAVKVAKKRKSMQHNCLCILPG